MKTVIGIIGVTGYTGQELLRLLFRHPDVRVEYLASLRAQNVRRLGELLPEFSKQSALSVVPFKPKDAIACGLLFLALPHGEAMKIAPDLLRRNKALKIIDLSGDFRLRSAAAFARSYGIPHTAPEWLARAAYGLSEWNRDTIRRARLIANPGCYPTATVLAVAPLAKAGLLAPEGLIVDAKSGVTGAGRSLREEMLFSEVNEDFRAYKVNAHQHIPEMEQAIGILGAHGLRMTFVPHLVPTNRGLYATVYAPLKRKFSQAQVRALYEKAYEKERFVRLLPGQDDCPQVKSVLNTNDCEIAIRVHPSGRRVILLSAIDNLGKGAAGQAVQNMNITCGLTEEAPWRSSREE